jgi:hypothetical protein
MTFSQWPFWINRNLRIVSQWKTSRWQTGFGLVSLVLVMLLWVGVPTASAGLTDDRFDGNIFTLYAGDGSLVPPKVSLEASLKGQKATFLVLYTDDSSDCKQYTRVVSQLQGLYGKVTDFIPLRADAIPVKATYAPTEVGYYFDGLVPKTVIFNQAGNVVLQGNGNLDFERMDDTFRTLFDLLPRSESVPLRRRSVNEITTELTP